MLRAIHFRCQRALVGVCVTFSHEFRAFARYHDENSCIIHVNMCLVVVLGFLQSQLKLNSRAEMPSSRSRSATVMWKFTIQESRKDKYIAKVFGRIGPEQKVGLDIFHPSIELLTLFHGLK